MFDFRYFISRFLWLRLNRMTFCLQEVRVGMPPVQAVIGVGRVNPGGPLFVRGRLRNRGGRVLVGDVRKEEGLPASFLHRIELLGTPVGASVFLWNVRAGDGEPTSRV